MKILKITVKYGGTVSLPNYCNAKLSESITVEVEPGESVADVRREAWRIVKESVRDQARELTKKPGARVDPAFLGESAPAEQPEAEPETRPDPKPKSLNDLVTPKQLWMLRGLARDGNFDAEAECRGLYQCGLEEISKKAASSLIDYFKRIVKGMPGYEPLQELTQGAMT